jgi:hypothetical protein
MRSIAVQYVLDYAWNRLSYETAAESSWLNLALSVGVEEGE